MVFKITALLLVLWPLTSSELAPEGTTADESLNNGTVAYLRGFMEDVVSRSLQTDPCKTGKSCKWMSQLRTVPNPYLTGLVTQIITETKCLAKITDFKTQPDGKPGEPEFINSGICDACELAAPNKGKTAVTYHESSGWSFCFSLGGEASWQTPPVVGPEWKVTANFEVCYETSKTRAVTLDIECNPGTKVQATVYETEQKTKGTIKKEVYQQAKIEWNKASSTPSPKGFPRFSRRVCTTVDDESSDITSTYHAKFKSLPCPPLASPDPSSSPSTASPAPFGVPPTAGPSSIDDGCTVLPDFQVERVDETHATAIQVDWPDDTPACNEDDEEPPFVPLYDATFESECPEQTAPSPPVTTPPSSADPSSTPTVAPVLVQSDHPTQEPTVGTSPVLISDPPFHVQTVVPVSPTTHPADPPVHLPTGPAPTGPSSEPISPPPTSEVEVDFSISSSGERINHGDYVKYEWLPRHGFTVWGSSSNGGYTPDGSVRVYDTSNENGADPDLGSPNKDCSPSGPGVGVGGGPGAVGENCEPQGMALIIQESNKTEPDDNAYGGRITFDFESPRKGLSLRVLDVDGKGGNCIELYIPGITPSRRTLDIGPFEDNSVHEIFINTEGVTSLSVIFSRSGAVTSLTLGGC